MKRRVFLLSSLLFLPACAHSLEQIMEERHQARLEQSNVNQPVNRGASDGLGSAFISNHGISLRPAVAHPPQPKD